MKNYKNLHFVEVIGKQLNGSRTARTYPLRFNIPFCQEGPFALFERAYKKPIVDPIKKYISISPKFLQAVVEPFNTPDEILMIYTSTIVALGPTMPKVFFKYDGRETYPMLMLFIAAPPSSGKGILRYSQKLTFLVQKELMEISNQLLENFKVDLKEALRQRKRGNMVPIPQQPKSPILVLPGNISSASLIEILSRNGDDNAILLFELEADSFGITSSRQDFGNMNSTILRSLFHSEPISVSRKTDGQHIVIDKPKGAVIFSGTESQIQTIFQSNKDGLFSRFTFLTINGNFGWKNVFPDEENSLDDYFKLLEPIYYQLWQYLRNRTVEVRFSKKQELTMNEWGKSNLANTHNFLGEYADSIPKRHTNMMARFAVTLRMLRYFEEKESGAVIHCLDSDLEIAKWICSISIANSLRIFKSLPGERVSSDNSKKGLFWEMLDTSFKTSDLHKAGIELGIPVKTQYNWVQRFIKTGLLERVNSGEYKKTSLAQMAMA